MTSTIQTSAAVARPVRPALALTVLAATQFLVILNASSVNLAMPSVVADFGLSAALSVWVVSGYLLVFGGLLLFGGRLGDVVGRRRLLVVGATVFGAAALFGGLAPTAGALIAARAVQGGAAAVMAPAALSLLTTTFSDPTARRRALGVWGAVASSGGAAGVLAGGGLTAVWGWRAVLLLNVPFVIALVAAIPSLVPASPRVAGSRLNVLGALLSFSAIAAIIAGLTLSSSNGWLSPVTLVPLLGGVFVLVVFLVTEKRSEDPLIPLHLLTRWPSVGGHLGMVSIAFALYPTMLISSIMLQTQLGFSPLGAGLMMLPLSLATVAASLSTPRIIARTNMVRSITTGLIVVIIALVALATTISLGTPLAVLVPSLIVFGAGIGLAVTSATNLALSGAEPREAGSASGLLQTAQQLGGAVGLTIVTTIAAAVGNQAASAAGQVHAGGYALGLIVAAGLAAAATITLAVRTRSSVSAGQ